MKLISIAEIKELRSTVRGLIGMSLAQIVATADYKTMTPFKQKLSIDGHHVTASFYLIPEHPNGHDCGQSPKVAVLDITTATGSPFQIAFEAEDFGQPVPNDIIEEMTDGYLEFATLAAVDQYIIEAGIAQEIIDAFNAGEFGRLEEQSKGLIQTAALDNYHRLCYKDPDGNILFNMEYDDGAGLYKLHPDFHSRAASANYVRCYLDAVIRGYLHEDAQVSLAERA